MPRFTPGELKVMRLLWEQGELKPAELQERLRELALPTLLVTHDFDDAAALADRVGVMAEGRILQLGKPDELVAAPSDAFVATRYSHVRTELRPSKRGSARQARSSASWSASSASSTDPSIR